MKLRDYQEQAVAWLRSHDRAGLFMDMGLGKTAATLSALEPRHLPALVVAPKRVAEMVWPEEQALWRPDLTLRVAMGSPTRRAAVLGQQQDITVISRDNLADINPGGWRTIILDELSSYKGRGVRWKQARKLTTPAAHVWGLTGTPTPNGLMDLWPQIYLLDNGQRLGTGIGHYRTRYFAPGRRLPNGVITSWDLRPGADKRIHALLEDLCLSMSTEGRVELPPVTFNPVEVTLPKHVRTAYDELKADLTTNLDILGVVHTAANAAVLSGKLCQLSAGCLYDDDHDINGQVDTVHLEKINAVREIVEGTGSPVLVFYRFKWELQQLQRALPQARTVKELGSGLQREWNAGNVPVLLAHPAGIGHGLNLQHGGHTAIWTSPPWSLEEWDQANKRLARSGQKHPVVIHILRAKGTLDASIQRRLETKTSVQDALLDHLEEKAV